MVFVAFFFFFISKVDVWANLSSFPSFSSVFRSLVFIVVSLFFSYSFSAPCISFPQCFFLFRVFTVTSVYPSYTSFILFFRGTYYFICASFLNIRHSSAGMVFHFSTLPSVLVHTYCMFAPRSKIVLQSFLHTRIDSSGFYLASPLFYFLRHFNLQNSHARQFRRAAVALNSCCSHCTTLIRLRINIFCFSVDFRFIRFPYLLLFLSFALDLFLLPFNLSFLSFFLFPLTSFPLLFAFLPFLLFLSSFLHLPLAFLSVTPFSLLFL